MTLVFLMERYGFTLPHRTADTWRVVTDKGGSLLSGWLVAPEMPVTLLATDGVVCWCVRGDGKTLVFAHLANFEAKTEEKELLKRSNALPKTPSKRQLLLASI